MSSPGLSYSERAGLGSTKGFGDRCLFIGVCSGIAANTLTRVPRTADVATLLGQGPGAEALAIANRLEGKHGDHYVISPTNGVAAAWGSITKVGGHAGPTITFTSSIPYDRYQWRWRTTTTGDLGAGRGQYSLDGGFEWSPIITIPSGGTYAMANTNTTLTFPAGTYTAGQEYTGESTEPYFSTTNLGTAITAALAETAADWDMIVLCGAPADATAGASMYSALGTQLDALVVGRRYNGAILDVGGPASAASTKTAMASLSHARLLPCYASVRQQSGKGFTGFSRPLMSFATVVGARAAASLISESLGRVESGPLRGVTEASYDETVSGAMNDDRICVPRSFEGNNPEGFYVNFDHVKAPVGSDIYIWPLRRVADRGAKVVSRIMMRKILENFPTKNDGSGQLDDVAANELQEELTEAVKAELVGKRDRSGKNGHAKDAGCIVDRSNNYAQDRTINVTTLINANFPAEQIVHTLSFTKGPVTGAIETPAEPPESEEE